MNYTEFTLDHDATLTYLSGIIVIQSAPGDGSVLSSTKFLLENSTFERIGPLVYRFLLIDTLENVLRNLQVIDFPSVQFARFLNFFTMEMQNVVLCNNTGFTLFTRNINAVPQKLQ
jgi:hypothetical protein